MVITVFFLCDFIFSFIFLCCYTYTGNYLEKMQNHTGTIINIAYAINRYRIDTNGIATNAVFKIKMTKHEKMDSGTKRARRD